MHPQEAMSVLNWTKEQTNGFVSMQLKKESIEEVIVQSAGSRVSHHMYNFSLSTSQQNKYQFFKSCEKAQFLNKY
jgi:hypothetical protein